MNFYAVLVIIIVLGLASVLWARHYYQNGSSSTTTPPLVGTTSYAGLAFDVCGKLEPSLLPSPSTSTAPLTAQTGGVVKIAPTTTAQAGTNANVALFAKDYPRLTVNPTTLGLPSTGTTKAVTYTNGETCPKGTPEAGKTGIVMISYWSSFAQRTPTTSSDPSAIHFTGNSLVTVSFLPAGVVAKRPSASTIQSMLGAITAGSTTTTPSATTTTTPTSSTTTTPSPSTTAAPTTTTTVK
jgi:hypothetical protein